MSTLNQKKVFERVASQVTKGNKVNFSKAMKGIYSPDYHATRLTSSSGWIELVDQCGLTDEFLLSALYRDIKNKPKNRKAELELAFKIKGRMKDPHIEGGNFAFFWKGDRERYLVD